MPSERKQGLPHLNFLWIISLLFIPLFIFSSRPVSAENTGKLLETLRNLDPEVTLTTLDASDAAKDPTLMSLLARVANNIQGDWHVRITAIRMLGETRDPRATDALMNAVIDFCPSIRWNAANALGGFADDPRVIDALTGVALRDDTIFVREEAIRSLGRLGNSKAVPALLDSLTSQNFSIRYSAIRSLSQIRSPQAIPYLKRLIDQEGDALLKNEARAAIEKVESGRETVVR